MFIKKCYLIWLAKASQSNITFSTVGLQMSSGYFNISQANVNIDTGSILVNNGQV